MRKGSETVRGEGRRAQTDLCTGVEHLGVILSALSRRQLLQVVSGGKHGTFGWYDNDSEIIAVHVCQDVFSEGLQHGQRQSIPLLGIVQYYPPGKRRRSYIFCGVLCVSYCSTAGIWNHFCGSKWHRTLLKNNHESVINKCRSWLNTTSHSDLYNLFTREIIFHFLVKNVM